MQSLIDTEPSHRTVDDFDQSIQSKSLYQLIYVHEHDERVKVVETPTIQFEHILTWLRMGNSIFITQKH